MVANDKSLATLAHALVAVRHMCRRAKEILFVKLGHDMEVYASDLYPHATTA